MIPPEKAGALDKKDIKEKFNTETQTPYSERQRIDQPPLTRKQLLAKTGGKTSSGGDGMISGR